MNSFFLCNVIYVCARVCVCLVTKYSWHHDCWCKAVHRLLICWKDQGWL